MMRKMVEVEPATLTALELLATDKGRRLQDLFDEAIADLLKKHRRPTTTKDMFAQTLRRTRNRRR
jgi:hypothetical protein